MSIAKNQRVKSLQEIRIMICRGLAVTDQELALVIQASADDQITSSIDESFASVKKVVEPNVFRRIESMRERMETLEKRLPQLFVPTGYRFPDLHTIDRQFYSVIRDLFRSNPNLS